MNLDLLCRLCETPGVPGREERVRKLIESEVRGLFTQTVTDPMGSLICTRGPSTTGRGKGKHKPTRVMIAAHMDEIGFYVRHVDEQGFVWVNPAGGFDARNLFSRRVLVCCYQGDYPGVMNPGGKPVHIATPEDRKKVPELNEFFVDLGMDAKAVQKLVKIGDFVVMDEPFLEQPTTVVSKALDNRIACFVAIEAVRKLAGASGDGGARTTPRKPGKGKGKGKSHACEVIVAFTVQEEVGLRGAMTAAHAVNADIGIGLDTTLACDTPGVPDNQRVTKMHDGVSVMVQDSSMIADYRLVDELCATAKSARIPYQRSILPAGGQDGAAIQKSHRGVRTAAIVVGTRYIHTVTESISKRDLQAAIDLLAEWLSRVA